MKLGLLFLNRKLSSISRIHHKNGFSLVEGTIAVAIGLIIIMGIYSLLIVTGKYYKNSQSETRMYNDSRVAIERMFKDISETSSNTITIASNAISFASARDENGNFILKPYSNVLKSDRPDWQKAIVYYVLEGDKGKSLYRKEIKKTNWSSNYDPNQAIDANGELIAQDVKTMNFDFSPADSIKRAHTLQVNLVFSKTKDEVGSDIVPKMNLSTRIPIMNRGK